MSYLKIRKNMDLVPLMKFYVRTAIGQCILWYLV